MAESLNNSNGGFQRWVLAAAGALAIAGIGGAIHQYGKAQSMTAELKEVRNTLDLEVKHLKEIMDNLDVKLQTEDKDWFNQLNSKINSVENEVNFRRDQIIELQQVTIELKTVQQCKK